MSKKYLDNTGAQTLVRKIQKTYPTNLVAGSDVGTFDYTIFVDGESGAITSDTVTVNTGANNTVVESGTSTGGEGTIKVTTNGTVTNPEVYGVAKLSANNTFGGNNTFSNNVTIPQTPSADTDAASKKYVDSKILESDAMQYKGSLNTSTDLPETATSANGVKVGATYKVATAGTYDGHANCKVGDMFIAQAINSSTKVITWDYIPSADDVLSLQKTSTYANITDLTNKVTGSDVVLGDTVSKVVTTTIGANADDTKLPTESAVKTYVDTNYIPNTGNVKSDTAFSLTRSTIGLTGTTTISGNTTISGTTNINGGSTAAGAIGVNISGAGGSVLIGAQGAQVKVDGISQGVVLNTSTNKITLNNANGIDISTINSGAGGNVTVSTGTGKFFYGDSVANNEVAKLGDIDNHIVQGNGITVTKNGYQKTISANPNTAQAISVDSAGIAVNYDARVLTIGTGDQANKLTLNVGRGMTIDGNGYSINADNTKGLYIDNAGVNGKLTALIGNGIEFDTNGHIAVKVDSNNANGLSTSANGVALAVATDSVTGAMSSTDHAKLTKLPDTITPAAEGVYAATIATTGQATYEQLIVMTDTEINNLWTEVTPPSPIITGNYLKTANLAAGTTVTINMEQDQANDYTIDWGDGSASEQTGNTTNESFNMTHTYTNTGSYTIQISASSGIATIGWLNSVTNIAEINVDCMNAFQVVSDDGLTKLTLDNQDFGDSYPIEIEGLQELHLGANCTNYEWMDASQLITISSTLTKITIDFDIVYDEEATTYRLIDNYTHNNVLQELHLTSTTAPVMSHEYADIFSDSIPSGSNLIIYVPTAQLSAYQEALPNYINIMQGE